MSKPMTAARVSEIGQSVVFFNRQLGFDVLSRDDAADVAVIDVGGYAVLLAGPGAGDLTPYLNKSHEILPPAGTIHAFAQDLNRLYDDLRLHSVPRIEFVERPWGDRLLRVHAPDGYVVSYWTEIERTADHVLRLYARGLDELLGLVETMDDGDLDLRFAPGYWTIRQTIHHLVHSEITSLSRIMHSLAEPGTIIHGSPYSQDVWVAELHHTAAPVETALALLVAIRHYVRVLLGEIPDAWDRTIRSEGGTVQSVRVMISMLSIHALEHVEDIRSILDMHARTRPDHLVDRTSSCHSLPE